MEKVKPISPFFPSPSILSLFSAAGEKRGGERRRRGESPLASPSPPTTKKVLEMGAEGEGKEREQKATERPYAVVARLGWRLSPRDIFR